MTSNPDDYFLFIGSADSESATTRLRASGAIYRKKLLNSRPENWVEIVDLITSPHNRGTLVVLSANTYAQNCTASYEPVARHLLDSLVGRPHVIFVHEEVFLSEEQRATAEGAHVDR